MKEIYVHMLRYRYYGRSNRRSRTVFPVSYGPFENDDVAREWIRQTGITFATRLMAFPAKENIKVVPELLPGGKGDELGKLVSVHAQQTKA